MIITVEIINKSFSLNIHGCVEPKLSVQSHVVEIILYDYTSIIDMNVRA